MNKLKASFLVFCMAVSVAAIAQSDRLNGGDKLVAGQTMFSANHKIKLVMQQDGNLVLYTTHDEKPIWAAATNGSDPRFAIMQDDGNFVVYNLAKKALWASNTVKYRGAFLGLQNDGNMVIYKASKAVWSTGTAGKVKQGDDDGDHGGEHASGGHHHDHNEAGVLGPNSKLVRGQSIMSEDKKIKLSMLESGELALFNTDKNEIIWSSMTMGTDAAYALMQNDGNFGVFNNAGQMFWSSLSGGHPLSYLKLQNDGNMVVGTENDRYWSTGTIGRVLAMRDDLPTDKLWPGKMMPGNVFYKGQFFISENKKLRLTLQDNGNLVLFANSTIKEYNNDALWASMTKGSDASFAIMQADGNLVLYSEKRNVLWSSKTGGKKGAYLSMEKDGNMIIKQEGGKELWQSDTRGYLINTNLIRQKKVDPHAKDREQMMKDDALKEKQSKDQSLKDKSNANVVPDKEQILKDREKAAKEKEAADKAKAQAGNGAKTAADNEREAQERAKAARDAADAKVKAAEEKRKAIEKK